MEVVAFLLICAAAHMLRPAYCAALQPNLNDIIVEIDQYENSLTKADFVEDVQNLADAGCENRFFCKVEEILSHARFEEHEQVQKMLRNLRAFQNAKKVKCPKKSGKERPKRRRLFSDLLRFLQKCSKKRNTLELLTRAVTTKLKK